MTVNWRIALVLILSVLVGATSLIGGDSSNDQPIQFNHQFHIYDQELECFDCHVQVENDRRASIPTIDICADCHEDMDTDIEEAQKVVDHISDDTEIPWVQIHVVPDHAFFSHRRHVLLGALDCSTCHGDVSEKTTPFTEPYTDITMDWCRDCHKDNLVTLDCNTCHR